MTPFDGTVLAATRHVLLAYVGENARNDYPDLIESRARVSMILGSERVFGYGSSVAAPVPFAELFTETRWVEGDWVLGPARLLDAGDPLPGVGHRAAGGSAGGVAGGAPP